MIKGLYSSAAGMLGQIEQQDAITNNLANVNSPGYKRLRVSFSSFDAELANASRSQTDDPQTDAGCMLPVATVHEDGTQGSLQDTGSRTNLAINGPGSFVVGMGNLRHLTRSGVFSVDGSGKLVTTDGEPVIGQRGPVSVGGGKWEVGGDGAVKVDGLVVDKLSIQTGDGKSATPPGQVVQGRLEGSNVSVIREMTSMIAGLRSYEANQKVIQAIDQTLDKVINTAGRTA